MSERARWTSKTKQTAEHKAPADCPVCGDRLAVTRLGCPSCGTELAGVFASCPYCALDENESQMLAVFLSSRGNMREVEKHLGVSYPTARLRFAQPLEKLGLGPQPESAPLTREQVLSEVATGALSPEEAAQLLESL